MTTPARRPCACRGWIEPTSHAGIPAAVDDHNAGAQHQAWRYDRIMAGDLVTPESPAEHVRRILDPVRVTYGIPIPTVRPIATDPELVSAGRPTKWDGEL